MGGRCDINKTHPSTMGGRCRPIRPVALLPVSAFLLSTALALPAYSWLGWLALLPLFRVIQVLRPAHALLAGGVWGASLYVFSVGPCETGLAEGILPFALLTLAPALYAFGGAHLTRRIGYSPFVLAVGWILLELALKPLNLRHGLLAATQGNGLLVQFVGGVFGYAFVAFLVALASACFLSVLARVRLPNRVTTLSEAWAGWITRLVSSVHSLRYTISSQPRAPPVPCLASRLLQR